MRPRIGPLCDRCIHLRADYSCAVFGGTIPDDIVQGRPHTEPFPGDGGRQFEARADDDPGPEFIDLMDEYMPEQSSLRP